MAISPSATLLALSARSRGLTTVFVRSSDPGGRPSRRLFAGPGSVSQLEWSADGRWLAVGWRGGDGWVFVRTGGKRGGARTVLGMAPRGPGTGFPRIADWC